MKTPYFTTKEAARITGFRTQMMVDYLCRTGIVVPGKQPKPGRGKPRLYTLGDLVLLKAVNRLLSSGLPVSRLKKAFKTLRSKFRHLGPESAIEQYLITNGDSVILKDEPSALVDLTEDGQFVFAFIVDVKQAREEVIDKINDLPQSA